MEPPSCHLKKALLCHSTSDDGPESTQRSPETKDLAAQNRIRESLQATTMRVWCADANAGAGAGARQQNVEGCNATVGNDRV